MESLERRAAALAMHIDGLIPLLPARADQALARTYLASLHDVPRRIAATTAVDVDDTKHELEAFVAKVEAFIQREQRRIRNASADARPHD